MPLAQRSVTVHATSLAIGEASDAVSPSGSVDLTLARGLSVGEDVGANGDDTFRCCVKMFRASWMYVAECGISMSMHVFVGVLIQIMAKTRGRCATL